MIPISAEQILEYKDDESGIIYEFRPLLGSTEFILDDYLEYFNSRHEPFMEKAALEISQKEKDGEVFEDRAAAIKHAAIKMAPSGYTKDPEYIRRADKVIDAALCGWRGQGIPDFPKDGNPSRMFKRLEKTVLVSAYLRINELTGDDKKN